jgi:hypothetical protein
MGDTTRLGRRLVGCPLRESRALAHCHHLTTQTVDTKHLEMPGLYKLRKIKHIIKQDWHGIIVSRYNKSIRGIRRPIAEGQQQEVKQLGGQQQEGNSRE